MPEQAPAGIPEMKDILIVEDVDSMRDLLVQVVEKFGSVRVSGKARNCWEARLELSRRRPALVLLDEVLPGESGLDLMKEILEQGIPVLLITGMEDPSHPVFPGVLGRLVKPAWDTFDADCERFRSAIAQVFPKSG